MKQSDDWVGKYCPECGSQIDSQSLRFNGMYWEHKDPEAHPQAGHHIIDVGDDLNLSEYQSLTNETAVFPDELPAFLDAGQVYVVMGQAGETGEIVEKLKKAIREDEEEYIDEMKAEVGDTLWYLAQVCEQFDWSLEEVAQENIDKLLDRKERGQITGQGDNR